MLPFLLFKLLPYSLSYPSHDRVQAHCPSCLLLASICPSLGSPATHSGSKLHSSMFLFKLALVFPGNWPHTPIWCYPSSPELTMAPRESRDCPVLRGTQGTQDKQLLFVHSSCFMKCAALAGWCRSAFSNSGSRGRRLKSQASLGYLERLVILVPPTPTLPACTHCRQMSRVPQRAAGDAPTLLYKTVQEAWGWALLPQFTWW